MIYNELGRLGASGNHHYGVVGLATGLFSEETLLRAAGDAQIKNKTSNPAWIKWELVETIGDGGVYSRMLPPYGDDPRDQYWITEGYKYLKTRFP